VRSVFDSAEAVRGEGAVTMKAFKETVMHWVESLRKKSSQQILQVQHQLVSISLMSVCLLFTHHTVPPSFQLNIPNAIFAPCRLGVVVSLERICMLLFS